MLLQMGSKVLLIVVMSLTSKEVNNGEEIMLRLGYTNEILGGNKLYVYNENTPIGYVYGWSKPDIICVNDFLSDLDTDNPAKQILVYKRIQQYLNVEKRSPLEIVVDENGCGWITFKGQDSLLLTIEDKNNMVTWKKTTGEDFVCDTIFIIDQCHRNL